jgi:signal transduction histidine kinase
MDRENENVNEISQDLLALCSRNADRLLALVDDLLELGRAESLPMNRPESVNVADVVESVVQDLAPFAIEQRARLEFSPASCACVDAETEGIRRIATNLISNAIKFSPNGTIDVSVANVADRIVMTVRDTGIGISEDRLATLFDRYTSIERCASHSGTGLGLSITKALVERFGGSIRVQSAEHRGTTFAVMLPRSRTSHVVQTVNRRAA